MNKIIRSLMLPVLLLATTVHANATIFDFKAMAEPGGAIGESVWTSLALTGTGFNVAITATKNNNAAFAYLDAGNAGLGVCGAALSALNTVTHSSTNRCNPGSDDNTTVGEVLRFVFSTNVTIATIWFNDNHDGDRSLLGNQINIGGSPYLFTNGGFMLDSSTIGSYNVAANTPFLVSYNNEQFYMSKMDVSVPSVPEPASVLLLMVGLSGMVLAGKRLNSLY